MCLSKVYLSREDKDEIVAVDESKKVKGYFIKEVDFINNRTILSKRK
jgi:hypothetical protein